MSLDHTEILRDMGLMVVCPDLAGPALKRQGGHAYSAHESLWAYFPDSRRQPFGHSSPPVFSFFQEGTKVEELAKHSRYFVLVGAGDGPALRRVLALPGTIKLVFDPSRQRVEDLVNALGRKLVLAVKPLFISGDPDQADPPLLWTLPEGVNEAGFPVFLVEPGLREAMPGYVKRVIQLVELFFYRHILYGLEGQDLSRSIPIRPMKREATYDQVRHGYENLASMVRQGTLNDLAGCLKGEPAILIAAGPALDEKLDWIRASSDKALLIAVNNSLPTLAKAGIEPHLAVINDTSVDSGKVFARLPELENCALAPYCLSASGGEVFKRKYFWGNDPTGLFPGRPMLMLHGSVITTAFALAEFLGCCRAYLVGVQLCSPLAYSLSYSKDSGQGTRMDEKEELILKWPQLYPVRVADGSAMYTSLNFFDAAQWFLDRIRSSPVEVVNTSAKSIVYGHGVVVDESPVLPGNPGLADRLRNMPGPKPPAVDMGKLLAYLRAELVRWREKRELTAAVLKGLAEEGRGYVDRATAIIRAFDQDNTTYMLQRFQKFSYPTFNTRMFDPETPTQKLEALEYYFNYAHEMASELLAVLKHQILSLTPPKS